MNPIADKPVFTNLVAEFPALVEHCVQSFSRSPERDLHILRRRYGLDGGPINTLAELGAYHEVARERVRQIQAKAVKRIRQTLEGDDHKARGIRASTHLRLQFKALIDDLRQAGPCLSRSRIQREARARFGQGVTGHWFSLFTEVLGFRLLQPTKSGAVQGLKECWVEAKALSQKTINQVFETLKDLQKNPEGVSLATMLSGLRSSGNPGLSEAWLKGIIAACSRVEVTRGEVVRVRTEWLSCAADQAWRVLGTTDKPMSRDEVARRVNKARVGKRNMKPMTVESVATQMSTDSRFVCSGKSGIWGLAEWGTVTDITIVEAMEKALHAAGEPLGTKKLVKATLKLRPDASPKSVRSYVQQRPNLFNHPKRGSVGLTAWGLQSVEPNRQSRMRCSKADFLAAVELAREGRDRMPLAKLVARIVDLTDMAGASVRQRLQALHGLNIEGWPGHKGKLVRFGAEISFPYGDRPTVREQVQETIHTLLEHEGIVFERKKDLYEKVNLRLPCERSTFYRYLSEME